MSPKQAIVLVREIEDLLVNGYEADWRMLYNPAHLRGLLDSICEQIDKAHGTTESGPEPESSHPDLTSEAVDGYVRSKGYSCPFCLSTNLQSYPPQFDQESIFCEVDCLNCGRCWKDEYVLNDVVTNDSGA